jgi:maleylacetoacetate isomerase
MPGAIVLHDYWRSSSAYRVRIALNLLGLAYSRVEVNLAAGEQVSAAHLTLNPQGLVPVLEIDGLRLTQSLAIVEYLDETRNGGLLPNDVTGRVRAKVLAHAIAMDIQPICNLRVVRHAVGTDAAATADWMGHFIHLGLTGVEGILQQAEETPFCHGNSPGLADICLVPQIYNARRWSVDLRAFPRLMAIASRAEAIAAIAAAHPDHSRPAA